MWSTHGCESAGALARGPSRLRATGGRRLSVGGSAGEQDGAGREERVLEQHLRGLLRRLVYRTQVRAHRPALDERKPTGHSALQNWEASRAPQASGAWSVVHGEGRLAAKARPRPLWPAAPLAIALPLVVSTAEPPPACRSEQEQRLAWNEQTMRERRRRDESGRGPQLPAVLACPPLAFPTPIALSRARAPATSDGDADCAPTTPPRRPVRPPFRHD
jgi:hypothetical protein